MDFKLSVLTCFKMYACLKDDLLNKFCMAVINNNEQVAGNFCRD